MNVGVESLKTVVRAAVPRPVRNWLRSPSRSAEWMWDVAAFSFGAKRRLTLLDDWSVICHPHFYKVVRQAQIVDPEQSAEFRNFISYCACGMFLFDVGAHFGIFSLAAAHFGGRAVAIDPSPTAAKMITTEARLNGCTKEIQILQAAVSDTSGEVGMLSSGVFSDGYFRFARGRSRNDLTRTQALTVDLMSLQYGIPTHIKIDVEGHEAAVLRGARSTLREASPFVFLELHNEIVASEGRDPTAALDELAALGYSTHSIQGGAISRAEILQPSIIRIVAMREPRGAQF